MFVENKIKSLSMRKMEKNFRGIEKGYPRAPYLEYDLHFWIYRLKQELNELIDSMGNEEILPNYENIKDELADLSNLIDYAYERTFIEEYSSSERKKLPDAVGLKQLYDHNAKLGGDKNGSK